jgi:long-chain acyl-CoA synthetase
MSRHRRGVISASGFRPFDVLERRARRVASGLEALGVGPGACVALLMRNDAPFLEVSYAVMRLGAYAVPLNWHFKAEEIAYILADCGARALFAHEDLLAGIADALSVQAAVFAVAPPAELLHAYGVAPVTQAIPGAIAFEPWLEILPEHPGPVRPAPMSMIYTSGTTGVPKGVRRLAQTTEQTVVLDALRAEIYGLKTGIRALLPGPLYHSAPNSFGLRSGKIGDLLVLMERFDPEALLRIIEQEAIDTVFMVPTMFIRLLKLPQEVRRRYDVSSLRHVIHAAAPCPPDVKTAMLKWWGPVIYEFYGGTESGPVSFVTPEEALKKPGTVGRASPGAHIRILDEDGMAVPQGAVGEIFSRIGAYPDFTYHNKDAMRAEVEKDGFITCGDMGYLDADGYLFICDRRRDVVISGGVNIYPAEIEGVLHGIEGVDDCAVFGIPDSEFGEALMAVVEPAKGAVLSPEAIRAHLSAHLADYKVPKAVEIRRGLPREDSGKIFKRRLRDPYWTGAGRRI